jgi:cyclase
LFNGSGGHTGCSAFAYFPEEKILFAGDEIATMEWPYISDETGNPDDYISALEQMMNLEIDKVIPGHGPIVGKDHINEYLVFISKLRRSHPLLQTSKWKEVQVGLG